MVALRRRARVAHCKSHVTCWLTWSVPLYLSAEMRRAQRARGSVWLRAGSQDAAEAVAVARLLVDENVVK